jgi:hypothetical protein
MAGDVGLHGVSPPGLRHQRLQRARRTGFEVRLGVRRAGVCMAGIDFNRLHFLVIDDNEHMRRILHTLLNTLPAGRSAQR